MLACDDRHPHLGCRGSYFAGNSLLWTNSIGFIFLTVSFLALPLVALLALDERVQTLLSKVRDWMNTNSWVVNEVVLLVFSTLTLNNLFG